jgi:threonine 3-dehydrogenase
MERTMKALVKRRSGGGLELEEVPVPGVGANDLLVRVQKAGICSTDVRILQWDDWARKTVRPPRIVGHEFVGSVARVGTEVTGFEAGETVSGEAHLACGVCRSCRAGRRHLCTDTLRLGVHRDGCFAEYVSLPAANAWRVDESVPLRVAAIFDAFGKATHAALSFDLVGEDVLITGAGPVGLMAIAISRHVGARNVVVVDLNLYRLGFAARMGATRVVDAGSERVSEAVAELGMVGFDVGIETSGATPALEEMLENMYNGGRIALLGSLPEPPTDGHGLVHRSTSVQIDWDQIAFRGLTIKGIHGRQVWETWYKMQTMLTSGLDIQPVITHELPLEDYMTAFAVAGSDQSGKVLLDIAHV